jgi:hypothetical protein
MGRLLGEVKSSESALTCRLLNCAEAECFFRVIGAWQLVKPAAVIGEAIQKRPRDRATHARDSQRRRVKWQLPRPLLLFPHCNLA